MVCSNQFGRLTAKFTLDLKVSDLDGIQDRLELKNITHV